MNKISLFFWSIGELGNLLSRFTDLYLKGNDIINCIFFKYRRQIFSLFLKNPVKKRKRTPVRFELTIWLLQGQCLNHWATKLLYKKW